MKLASHFNHKKDGQLLVVSKDLHRAVAVPEISNTLQNAIENWSECLPLLDSVYQQLNSPQDNSLKGILKFEASQVLSPLPRAYQWLDGSAYVNHVELVRKARGAQMPDSFWHDPLMYQGGSDDFLAPCEDIPLQDPSWGLDFEAELAIITDDVPMACSVDEAQSHIKLFMLVNDISLRNLIPSELAKGFGFMQSKPSSSFSPVAITPDELEGSWDGKKLQQRLTTHLNDQLFGEPETHVDMTFDFPTLVSHAAKTRKLSAGTIIGSGTISNYDRSQGSSCIAEKRMLEKIETDNIKTDFLQNGDTVNIEMLNEKGESIFGAIRQKVVSGS
jgi:fumarylacetoacetate (FAA) hydrolase